jgi:hypothetical protein
MAEQRKRLFKSARKPSTTLAIVVESYDLSKVPHTVTGIRIDNGERVSVFMRAPDYNPQSEASWRPEIRDFAAPIRGQNSPATEPGGTLVCDTAELERPGVYSARWIDSFSHNKDEAIVILACAHIERPSIGRGAAYSRVTFLHDRPNSHISQAASDRLNLYEPIAVKSKEEIFRAGETLLDQKLCMGLRIKLDEDDFDSFYASPHPEIPPAQRMEEAWEKQFSKLPEGVEAQVLAGIESGEILAEVIPFGQLFVGPKSLPELSTRQKGMVELYNEPVLDMHGKPRLNPVTRQPKVKPTFYDTVIAIRDSNPDPESGETTLIVTKVSLVRSRPPIRGLDEAISYARTSAFSPTPPDSKPRRFAPATASTAAPETQPTAPVATSREMDTTFDATDMSDDIPLQDDLMAAASRGAVQTPASSRQPRPAVH